MSGATRLKAPAMTSRVARRSAAAPHGRVPRTVRRSYEPGRSSNALLGASRLAAAWRRALWSYRPSSEGRHKAGDAGPTRLGCTHPRAAWSPAEASDASTSIETSRADAWGDRAREVASATDNEQRALVLGAPRFAERDRSGDTRRARANIRVPATMAV